MNCANFYEIFFIFLSNFATKIIIMLSCKVKRNISGTLLVVGVICVIARLWDVVMEPDSGRARFELCGMGVLTYLCFDSFMIYRRKWSARKSKMMEDGE